MKKKEPVYSTCFIREIEKDGKALWVLVDANGVAVCLAKGRSELFFFALEHGITIQMRN